MFRGKRTDNGEWVEGDLIHSAISAFSKIISVGIKMDGYYPIEVHPDTIGQFTGLLDKNGKRIFEGDYDQNHDVVMWCDKRNGWAMKTYDFPTREVISCHCFRCEGHFDIDDADFDIEIIGSIHDQNF